MSSTQNDSNQLSVNTNRIPLWAIHGIVLAGLILFDGPLFIHFHKIFDWMSAQSFVIFRELTKIRHWEFVKEFGSVWIAVIVWVFLWEYDKKKRKYLVPFLCSLAATTVIYFLLQRIVGKIRPSINNGIPFYYPFGLGWNIDNGLSFPSGHATFTFCFASLLSYLYPKRRMLFIILASLCALSRVVNQAHFFSDVYAGFLIGYYVTKMILKRVDATNESSVISDPDLSGLLSIPAHQFQSVAAHGLTLVNRECDPPVLSVVIPIKNEEENIKPLALEIEEALSTTGWSYEVVWINDGSGDNSASILDRLSHKSPIHRAIHFSENKGQSAALWIGFQQSLGAIIATLDGDGQNDPADLPSLVQQILDGTTDMANGYRHHRQDPPHRLIVSRIANAFRNWTTGRTVRDVGCSTRAIRSECVLHLPLFKGMHRFLPTLVSMQGYRLSESPVNHRPRLHGKTKYLIQNRLWIGFMDIAGIVWLRTRGFYSDMPKFKSPKVEDNSNETHSLCEDSLSAGELQRDSSSDNNLMSRSTDISRFIR